MMLIFQSLMQIYWTLRRHHEWNFESEPLKNIIRGGTLKDELQKDRTYDSFVFYDKFQRKM
jgi:hypothetical protein